MGIPILNHLLPQVTLIGLNNQPNCWKFSCVSSIQDMVLIISASHPILIRIIMGTFSSYQVFHQTTLQIYVIFSEINYVVLLSDFDIEFP